VSGCAAEVSSASPRRCSPALTKAIPDLLFAAPAGTSGNLGVGGYDPERNAAYIMYLFTGGGYGGFQGGRRLEQRLLDHRHLQDAPSKVLEQFYPVLFEESPCTRGRAAPASSAAASASTTPSSSGAARRRYRWLMDHGRTGPHGRFGREDGGTNKVEVSQSGKTYRPPHLSKGPGHSHRHRRRGARIDARAAAASAIRRRRDRAAIARDVARGYYSETEARAKFGVQ